MAVIQAAARIPIGLPATKARMMPQVTVEVAAPERTVLLKWRPALASAKSGTMTQLVHGWSRY